VKKTAAENSGSIKKNIRLPASQTPFYRFFIEPLLPEIGYIYTKIKVGIFFIF
jgi:hypothetical protein